MKKILTFVLLTLIATTAFSQDVEKLKRQREAELHQSYGMMGLGFFSFGLGATTFAGEFDSGKKVALTNATIVGVSLNLLAIRSFVRAKKLKKEIKRFEL